MINKNSIDFVSAEQTKLDMLLKQMGGTVKTINGLLCFVHFFIDNTELFYVYNINSKNKFYLQKVLPYPLGIGVFTTSAEVIAYIKEDIKRFKNASNSKNFETFVNINMDIHHTVHKVESAFMSHNIPSERLTEFQKEISNINDMIDEINAVCAGIITE